MFERTGRMYRYILDMPLDEKDDDIEVEGTLRYWPMPRAGSFIWKTMISMAPIFRG